MSDPAPLLDELHWRGLVHQCTDDVRLRAHLESARRKVYAGFDPTSDSLTIGNLVPIMLLVHVARSGHVPVVVMGGGTGLIGDPSGKSAERQLMTVEMVASNVESQRGLFARVFDGVGLTPPRIVNNLDWLGKLSFLEVLRDVGKHFSVNMMIQKDSVRSRLESRDQGISYTEFSYMILQSFDFLHLYENEGVTVQMGGSDQFGNIVSGMDLIGRRHPGDSAAFGLTAPLVTKADGGKFGKTESGAIWLSPHRTSPYAYFQFWLNAADSDALKWLRVFTLLDQRHIEELERAHLANPGDRLAQRELARAATTILHGESQSRAAEAAGAALFSGEVGTLPEATLNEVLGNAPSSTMARARLEGDGVPVLDLLVETALAQSRREAKEFLANGSVQLNGRKVGTDDRLRAADLLHGSIAAFRRGKKNWHVVRFG